MQAMPAFFWNKRRVFVSHRRSLIRERLWSSVAHQGMTAASRQLQNRRLPKPSLPQDHALPRRLHLRQMCHAIFFAIARHTEIEIRIAQLSGTANRTAMERFRCAARVRFETSAPCRNVVPVPRLMNDLGPKENEIVNEGGNERCAIRVRSQKEAEHQERSVNPRQPFNFYRQNKKDVNDFIGIETRECEEQ